MHQSDIFYQKSVTSLRFLCLLIHQVNCKTLNLLFDKFTSESLIKLLYAICNYPHSHTRYVLTFSVNVNACQWLQELVF